MQYARIGAILSLPPCSVRYLRSDGVMAMKTAIPSLASKDIGEAADHR